MAGRSGPAAVPPPWANTLPGFLDAYDLPAAVLDRGHGRPAYENDAFGALRSAHATLVQTLHAVVGAGKKRAGIVLDGRMVRWTVTHTSRTKEHGLRAVLLAHDMGDDEEGAEPTHLPSLSASASLPVSWPYSPSARAWTEDVRFAALSSIGGEMGDRIRSLDWAQTPLGPISSWPLTLVTTFGIMLHRHYPSAIVWGPQQILLYNTAYSAFLGPEKHPQALGRSAKETWAEIWDTAGPLHDRAYAGESMLFEAMQLFLPRRPKEDPCGRFEELYLTVSYVPLYEPDGAVGGFFALCIDMTAKVQAEQRADALRQLAKRLTEARMVSSLLFITCDVLRSLADVVPYVAAYRVVPGGHADGDVGVSQRVFELQERIGTSGDCLASPANIPVDLSGEYVPSASPVDLREMINHQHVTYHPGVAPLLSTLPQRGTLQTSPDYAAAIPITDGQDLIGCLIAYIGAGQRMDEPMKQFLDLLSWQVSLAATAMKSHRLKERKLEESATIRAELERQVAQQLLHLEESRESYTRLCELVPAGIHRTNPRGSVTWANRKWMTAFGLANDGLDNWRVAVHPKDLEPVERASRNAIRTGVGFAEPMELQLRNMTKEGVWLDVLYDFQPDFAHDAPDTIVGWIGIWFDVSGLRRLQKQAMEVERVRVMEADRNRELQEQFIDMTCHELRNPLNAIYNSSVLLSESLARIKSTVNLLQTADATAQLRSICLDIEAEVDENIDCAQTIVMCAKHQQRIADDVLNMSKLRAGLIMVDAADFSPWEEMNNTVRMFREEASVHNVDLRLERDSSLDALCVDRVRGDSGRLIQVVINLVSNALKFTEAAPRREVRVRIGATEAPEDEPDMTWPEMNLGDLLPTCRAPVSDPGALDLRLWVAVADTGRGMTHEEQDQLFQRFTQASPRTYGEFGGFGLGLYVSRMLIELLGGKIYVQSTKGLGAVLRFFVTVKRSVTIQAPDPTIANGYDADSKRHEGVEGHIDDPQPRVLVVEDNIINQRLLVKLLKSLGCASETCSDGQECVDLFESAIRDDSSHDLRFDLVLMDVEMPNLDGLQATRRIRQLEAAAARPHGIPIIAVSGNARPEWADRARDVGMDGFVRKPYGKAELEKVVKSWRPGKRVYRVS